MAIVTREYYTGTYYGEAVAEIDFPRYSARAERLISQITRGRTADYAALPADLQDAVKTAICAQIEYYAIYGIDAAVAGRQSAEFTVGKVHVGGGQVPTGKASMVCPAAISALEQTGLLNPQVAVGGAYPWGVC